MAPLQKAGLYYPNKFGLITIKSLEEVMGKNGLNAILNLAGLNHYVENYPIDNLDKGFDFAELSAIGSALEEMYGPRGGRGLALRAGRATFSDALRNFGALAGAVLRFFYDDMTRWESFGYGVVSLIMIDWLYTAQKQVIKWSFGDWG